MEAAGVRRAPHPVSRPASAAALAAASIVLRVTVPAPSCSIHNNSCERCARAGAAPRVFRPDRTAALSSHSVDMLNINT